MKTALIILAIIISIITISVIIGRKSKGEIIDDFDNNYED
jgi:uncharacterized protein YxeA